MAAKKTKGGLKARPAPTRKPSNQLLPALFGDAWGDARKSTKGPRRRRALAALLWLRMGYSLEHFASLTHNTVQTVRNEIEALVKSQEVVLYTSYELLSEQARSDFASVRQSLGEGLLEKTIQSIFFASRDFSVRVRIFDSGLPFKLSPSSYSSCIKQFVATALMDDEIVRWLARSKTIGLGWGRMIHALTEKCSSLQSFAGSGNADEKRLAFPIWGHALPLNQRHQRHEQLKHWDPAPSEINCTLMAQRLTQALGGNLRKVPNLSLIPSVLPEFTDEVVRRWFCDIYLQKNEGYRTVFGEKHLTGVPSARLATTGEDPMIPIPTATHQEQLSLPNGEQPSLPLIDRADTLLVGAGDSQTVGLYLHGLHADDQLDKPAAISEFEEGIYGDIGGAILRKSAPTGVDLISRIHDRWLGLRVEQISSIAKRAHAERKNGVMLWAIGRTRADIVIAALAHGSNREIEGFVTHRPTNSPMPLVNTLVIDHQLAAALLESLGQAKYEKLVGADMRRDLIAAGVALSGEGSDARSIAKTAAKTKEIR